MAKKRDKVKKTGARRVTDLPPKAKGTARVRGGGIQPQPFRFVAGRFRTAPQQGT